MRLKVFVWFPGLHFRKPLRVVGVEVDCLRMVIGAELGFISLALNASLVLKGTFDGLYLLGLGVVAKGSNRTGRWCAGR